LSAVAVVERLLDRLHRLERPVGLLDIVGVDNLQPTGDDARIDHRREKLADAIATKVAFRT
jgi:hypothetical protein